MRSAVAVILLSVIGACSPTAKPGSPKPQLAIPQGIASAQNTEIAKNEERKDCWEPVSEPSAPFNLLGGTLSSSNNNSVLSIYFTALDGAECRTPIFAWDGKGVVVRGGGYPTCFQAWLKRINGLQEGDRLKSINGKPVLNLDVSLFQIDPPQGAISIPFEVERARKDGFVGVETIELSIPISPSVGWRVARKTSWTVTSRARGSGGLASMVGMMNLGGNPHLVFVSNVEVGAVDVKTGCHRMLHEGPGGTPSVAILHKTNKFGWLLHVGYYNTSYERVDGPLGVFWKDFPSPSDKSALLRWENLPADPDSPCHFRAECMVDIDGDGELDFLSPIGASIRNGRLDFSNVKRLNAFSIKTGKLIFSKDVDNKTVSAVPGYQQLAKADFGTHTYAAPLCVHLDALGDKRAEIVTARRDGFVFESVPRKDNDVRVTVSYERIPGMGSLGVDSVSLFDTNNDGVPELQGLRSYGVGGETAGFVLLEINTGKSTSIVRPLCHGTPEGSIDPQQIASYLANPISMKMPDSPASRR